MFSIKNTLLVIYLTLLLNVDGNQNKLGVMDIMQEMMSNHFGRYSQLFKTEQSDDKFYTRESMDSKIDSFDNQASLWSKLDQVRNLIFRPEAYRQKQRDKFRRFSAEAPHAQTEARRTKYKENRELDRISQDKQVVLDKQMAENLFKRHHERVEQNHNQKFKGTHNQIFDLDQPINMVASGHRRVLESKNDTSADKNAAETKKNQTAPVTKVADETNKKQNSTVNATNKSTAASTTSSQNTTNTTSKVKNNTINKDAEVKNDTNTTQNKNKTQADKNDTKTNETVKEEKNQTNEPKSYPKNMDPNVMPDIPLWRLDEEYPDNRSPDTMKHCQHGSQGVGITQNYFMCQDISKPDTHNYRVTEFTYMNMTTLPYFKQRYNCNIVPTSREVCYCPAGYTGYTCDEFSYTKCYVNITTPALYKGCTGEDSEAYVYSIKGFDPCFHYDFTSKTTMKYLLQCRAINSRGLVKEGGHREGYGYTYANIVDEPNYRDQQFTYAAFNNVTNMRVMNGEITTVTVDFRDWKYLSDFIRFTTTSEDPQVIAGLSEGSIEVDFNKMSESDKVSKTRYVVGGRLFFEAHVFASGYTSFTTNAFLDQEGYVEPKIDTSSTQDLINWLPLIIPILFISAICTYYCCKKSKVKIEEDDNRVQLKPEEQKEQTN